MTNTMAPISSRTAQPTVVVGLAAIVGLVPFAIDMYLASLPDIGREFSAPVWATQLTLTGYLLLLGAGQLVAGPITDAVGRRRPLIVGLALFVIGSVIAALAPTMTWLIVARLFQATGGALAAVVANSTVRDRASGHAATQLFAVLMTVTALAPIVAPAVGGWLDTVLGWRSVFWALAILGIVTLLYAAAFLKESHPVERRRPLAIGSTVRGYLSLISNRAFVLPWAAMVSMFMLLFAYIGGASYVYQDDYGVSSEAFGLLFASTGIALMAGALGASRLAKRLQQNTLAVTGVALSGVGSALAVIVTITGAPIGLLVASIAVIMLGLGVSEPALMSNSLSSVEENTGQAAALLGAGQFVFGATTSGIAGLVVAFGPVAWTVLLLAIVLVALMLSLASTRTRR
ncbi:MULTISPECIES: multidrug effflux MFS transporter [unclassified Nocardiopsis]|uniref:multidrug effflux MFS transporter n=1 Tax=unclassified Nocardiopsis TaxID=2649073 RepID=UPI001F466622|nr:MULTISPECIES: multidrug effflux MFS transporter [unclassified Nocardiopsis]